MCMLGLLCVGRNQYLEELSSLKFARESVYHAHAVRSDSESLRSSRSSRALELVVHVRFNTPCPR